jgi:cyclase
MGLRPRVIPVLLLQNGKLVKTYRFKQVKYVGDPINAVKIFNEKEVDELILLDIGCSIYGVEPNYEIIHKIVSEAFMPIGYGGGITNVDQAKRIFDLGIEKVILNTSLQKNTELVTQISSIYGSSSVIACIDYRKNFFGKYKVHFKSGNIKSKYNPIDWAIKLQELGVGEIFLNNIDLEGTYSGYDYDLLSNISSKVSVPIVISGGASSTDDFKRAVVAGASGMAVGSMFIYKRPHNAVLISYPSNDEIKQIYSD